MQKFSLKTRTSAKIKQRIMLRQTIGKNLWITVHMGHAIVKNQLLTGSNVGIEALARTHGMTLNRSGHASERQDTGQQLF